MECPRCGGTVTVYQLGDRESYVCDDCEYVGIDVEHGAEPEQLESWDEALERFYERFAGAGDDEPAEERTADGDTSGGEAGDDDAPAGEPGEAEAGVEADGGGDGDEAAGEGAADAAGSGADAADGELTPAIVRVDDAGEP